MQHTTHGLLRRPSSFDLPRVSQLTTSILPDTTQLLTTPYLLLAASYLRCTAHFTYGYTYAITTPKTIDVNTKSVAPLKWTTYALCRFWALCQWAAVRFCGFRLVCLPVSVCMSHRTPAAQPATLPSLAPSTQCGSRQTS